MSEPRRELRWLPLKLPVAMAMVALLAARPLFAAEPAALSNAKPGPSALEILERHCIECHGGKATRSGLCLTTREGLLKGGESGAPLIPGKGQESRLEKLVSHAAQPGMPFRRKKLSDDQIAALRDWINAGAPYDRVLTARNDRAEKDGDAWWSLKPLRQPVPPVVPADRAAWAITPIDQFILARLIEKGLAPSPPAEKRTLLRRVMLDLVGLAPTPEQTAAFLADQSPDAYERLVDRLLASPQYGERWARHWMDTVHYAETHGHDQDRPRPNAWPYRDYLIRSFNDDKPYARFVQEQLAGDVLFPDDPEGYVAMGFLATGPWDESSLRDIREDAIDREIARYVDRDDIVTTAFSTLVSTTVHCARCHDHKFDPISQTEYYRLQAVFAGVDKAERQYDADPAVGRQRRQLTERLAQLPSQAAAADASLLTADLDRQVSLWENEVTARIVPWQILEPQTLVSAGGAKLSKPGDGSVLSAGTRPEKETVTVAGSAGSRVITGLKLELLLDDSLPQKGPGRADNGNLHLSEINVAIVPRNGAASGQSRPVKLATPRADFNQQGWTIEMAVDGNPATAWGVHPETGKPHSAVFEFAEPAELAEGAAVEITLQQVHGAGHVIGRFRLSTTNAPLPLPTQPAVLPDEIIAALKVPRDGRSARQRAALAALALRGQLERELAALPPPQKVYSATSQFQPDGSFRPSGKPRPVRWLRRGDINQPQEIVEPGTLECLPGLEGRFPLSDPDNEGSRRVALARWITDFRNVLAWRSIVNRVWHYHFGRGIVETPNDFGRMGGEPTHPELLDWLATTFQESGGLLKPLHRLIVTSAVYRQSSRSDPKFAAIDGDDKFLWRMPRARLDAESIRDTVLSISGKLDLTMGGPSVKQFIQSPGIHVTPVVDYRAFDVDRPENYRRSVYRFIFRTLPDPFMETLDCADASQLTPVRSASVTALQALAMLNNRFIVRQSEHIAARLEGLAPDGPGRVAAAYELILGRPATAQEAELVGRYAAEHGLANAVRMLLNSNEFMFVN
jgi:mono/diheme cytochrome c family protein